MGDFGRSAPKPVAGHQKSTGERRTEGLWTSPNCGPRGIEASDRSGSWSNWGVLSPARRPLCPTGTLCQGVKRLRTATGVSSAAPCSGAVLSWRSAGVSEKTGWNVRNPAGGELSPGRDASSARPVSCDPMGNSLANEVDGIELLLPKPPASDPKPWPLWTDGLPGPTRGDPSGVTMRTRRRARNLAVRASSSCTLSCGGLAGSPSGEDFGRSLEGSGGRTPADRSGPSAPSSAPGAPEAEASKSTILAKAVRIPWNAPRILCRLCKIACVGSAVPRSGSGGGGVAGASVSAAAAPSAWTANNLWKVFPLAPSIISAGSADCFASGPLARGLTVDSGMTDPIRGSGTTSPQPAGNARLC